MDSAQEHDVVTRGILYVATGIKYLEEAILSAESCKEHNNYPIALITDNADHKVPDGLFDHIIIKEATYSYRDKLLLRYTPFVQTIFLDTDTLVVANLDDLFTLLNYREFGIHQADEGYEFSIPGISNAMPEFNTGVIAYKSTPNVKKLFEEWEASFDHIPEITQDQYHLRKILYESDVRYAIFSTAYNFIIYYHNFVIQPVKIFHGRPFKKLQEVAKDVNHIRHGKAWRRSYYDWRHKYAVIYTDLNNKDIVKLLGLYMQAFLFNTYRWLVDKFKRA